MAITPEISARELRALKGELQRALRGYIPEGLSEFISGYKAFLVGGLIRDEVNGILIGSRWRPWKRPDIDLVIQGSVNILSEEFSLPEQKKKVVLSEEPPSVRFILAEAQVDVTTCEDIELDLSRRDFTLNSLALDLQTGELLDLFGGVYDIKRGVVRAISEGNLLADPIRLLRAPRMAISMSLRIDDATAELIRENRRHLLRESPSRVLDELLKFFKALKRIEGIFLLSDLKLDDLILGFELTPLRDYLVRLEWLEGISAKEKLILLLAIGGLTYNFDDISKKGLIYRALGRKTLERALSLNHLMRYVVSKGFQELLDLPKEELVSWLKSFRTWANSPNRGTLGIALKIAPKFRDYLRYLETLRVLSYRKFKVRSKDEFEKALLSTLKELQVNIQVFSNFNKS